MYSKTFEVEAGEDGRAVIRGVAEEPIKLAPGEKAAFELRVDLELIEED